MTIQSDRAARSAPAGVSEAAFWQAVVAKVNVDAAFMEASLHLKAVVFHLEIGRVRHSVEFHRGGAALLPAGYVGGSAFSISGPEAHWRRLVQDDVPFAQMINIHHGSLRLDGDLVAVNWSNPALWKFFRRAAQVFSEAGSDE